MLFLNILNVSLNCHSHLQLHCSLCFDTSETTYIHSDIVKPFLGIVNRFQNTIMFALPDITTIFTDWSVFSTIA